MNKNIYTENSSFALEIKQKSVIDMALTYTAMIRLFEKGSKSKIANKLYEEYQRLDKIINRTDFEIFHEGFCDWFTSNIKTTERKKNNRITKKSHYALYGHASKLLDVSLKVYVYYTSLPDKCTAETLLPFLNTAIDNPLLKYLRKSFTDEGIFTNTVEQIDKKIYKKLQGLIRCDIRSKFDNKILPTQYDDIMWYFFNRKIVHTDDEKRLFMNFH